jgi:hypothetical protein
VVSAKECKLVEIWRKKEWIGKEGRIWKKQYVTLQDNANNDDNSDGSW